MSSFMTRHSGFYDNKAISVTNNVDVLIYPDCDTHDVVVNDDRYDRNVINLQDIIK